MLGILLGAAGSLFLTRFMGSLLFGVSKNDYTSLALSVTLLFVVAMLAASIPSQRAARTDPLLALKNE